MKAKPKVKVMTDTEMLETMVLLQQQVVGILSELTELIKTFDAKIVKKESEGGIFAGDVDGDQDNDDLLRDAQEVVMKVGKASTSLLQRRLRIGYGRAARIMDLLEEKGVIGPADGSAPRDVLL